MRRWFLDFQYRIRLIKLITLISYKKIISVISEISLILCWKKFASQ